VIGQASRYGWRRLQRTTNASEVEVGHEQRDRRFVVLPLLAMPIREPGIATDLHAERLVRPLSMARADSAFVGRTDYRPAIDRQALAGRITPGRTRLRSGTKNLDDLPVVDVRPEHAVHGREV
jgi:hypothetical protein